MKEKPMFRRLFLSLIFIYLGIYTIDIYAANSQYEEESLAELIPYEEQIDDNIEKIEKLLNFARNIVVNIGDNTTGRVNEFCDVSEKIKEIINSNIDPDDATKSKYKEFEKQLEDLRLELKRQIEKIQMKTDSDEYFCVENFYDYDEEYDVANKVVKLQASSRIKKALSFILGVGSLSAIAYLVHLYIKSQEKLDDDGETEINRLTENNMISRAQYWRAIRNARDQAIRKGNDTIRNLKNQLENEKRKNNYPNNGQDFWQQRTRDRATIKRLEKKLKDEKDGSYYLWLEKFNLYTENNDLKRKNRGLTGTNLRLRADNNKYKEEENKLLAAYGAMNKKLTEELNEANKNHNNKTIIKVNSNLVCGVCLENKEDSLVLLSECPHLYCEECVKKIMKTKSICPCCRTKFDSYRKTVYPKPDSFINQG